jgi:hypothetical protein
MSYARDARSVPTFFAVMQSLLFKFVDTNGSLQVDWTVN